MADADDSQKAASVGGFNSGDRVRVRGLVEMSQHNGKIGVCGPPHAGEEPRMCVRLDFEATPLALKPANLEHVKDEDIVGGAWPSDGNVDSLLSAVDDARSQNPTAEGGARKRKPKGPAAGAAAPVAAGDDDCGCHGPPREKKPEGIKWLPVFFLLMLVGSPLIAGALWLAEKMETSKMSPQQLEAKQRTDWCEMQLRAIYNANDNSKLGNVAGLCKKHAGHEEVLVRKVTEKYSGELPE